METQEGRKEQKDDEIAKHPVEDGIGCLVQETWAFSGRTHEVPHLIRCKLEHAFSLNPFCMRSFEDRLRSPSVNDQVCELEKSHPLAG